MVTDYGHICIMNKKAITIGAGEFKAKCLKLLDEVQATKKAIVITKHGKPVATVIPYAPKGQIPLGSMKNSLKILGDIIGPTEEDWNAEQTD